MKGAGHSLYPRTSSLRTKTTTQKPQTHRKTWQQERRSAKEKQRRIEGSIGSMSRLRRARNQQQAQHGPENDAPHRAEAFIAIPQ